jgi:hypothetical protein
MAALSAQHTTDNVVALCQQNVVSTTHHHHHSNNRAEQLSSIDIIPTSFSFFHKKSETLFLCEQATSPASTLIDVTHSCNPSS